MRRHAGGQQKLNEIQKKIVDAVNTPTMAVDTPAGERSFLTFLRNQVSEIDDLLASGSLSAQDQSKAAAALAALYTADAGAPADPPAAQPPTAPPGAPAPDPPPAADPGLGAPGLGPALQAPDPGLSDMWAGACRWAPIRCPRWPRCCPRWVAWAPTPPRAHWTGWRGWGARRARWPGWRRSWVSTAAMIGLRDNSDDSPPRAKGSKDSKAEKDDPAKADTTAPGAGAQQQPAGQQGQNPNAGGEPPSPVAPPAVPSATVKLPDGSTATARNPQAAEAIRDYLAGETVDASYRKNGIELPPPGTPITHPVDPSRLTCGDLAMFKDHYVPALSSVKAYLNGQVVPLGSVASSPDFLGWIDPTAAATGTLAPVGLAPGPPVGAPPAAAPPAGAGLPAPVPAG